MTNIDSAKEWVSGMRRRVVAAVGYLPPAGDAAQERTFAGQMEVTNRTVRLGLPPGPPIAVGFALIFWRESNRPFLLVGLALLLLANALAWRHSKRPVLPERGRDVALRHAQLAAMLGIAWFFVTMGVSASQSPVVMLVQMAFRMALITVAMTMYLHLPLAFLCFSVPIAMSLILSYIGQPVVFGISLALMPVFVVICLRTVYEQSQSFRAAGETAERLRRSEARQRDADRQVEELRIQQAEIALHAQRREQTARQKAMLALAQQFEVSVVAVVDAMLAAVSDLDGSASSLAALTDSAASVAEDVAGYATATAESITALAGISEEMSHAITAIVNRVDDHARVSEKTRQVAEGSALRISDLSADASRIGDIITLIKEITQRTKLLALNATIEAARAGEAGRGFAVVAGEVKSLAQRAGDATSGVTMQIGSVMTRIGSATDDIRETALGIDGVAKIAGAIAGTMTEQRIATQKIEAETRGALVRVNEMNQRMVTFAEGARTARQMTGTVASTASRLTEQARSLDDAATAFLSQLRCV